MLLSGYVIPVSASGGVAAVEGGAPGYHHAPYYGEKVQCLFAYAVYEGFDIP